jgi:anti-anti-sigma factor
LALRCRDREVEPVAAGVDGRDADHSVVALDERAADRQSQSGARDATFVRPATVNAMALTGVGKPLRCPGFAIRVRVGPSSAVRDARAWLLERSDPAFQMGLGQHCAASRAGGGRVPVNSMSRLRPAESPADSQSGDLAPFRVVVREDRDVTRISPSGEVDIGTVGRIREQLDNATASGARRVVLDLRAVTFLDSSGLHLVLEADAASRAQGWEFKLIGGPAHVQRIFDLTGARARLPFLTASELAALLTAPREGWSAE